MKRIDTNLTPFVCAFNPVVCAQPLPKLSNFESWGLKLNFSYSPLSCESDQNSPHYNFTSMVFGVKTFNFPEKLIRTCGLEYY